MNNVFCETIAGLVGTWRGTLIVSGPHWHCAICPTLWLTWIPITRLSSCLNLPSGPPLTSLSSPTPARQNSALTKTVGHFAKICCFSNLLQITFDSKYHRNCPDVCSSRPALGKKSWYAHLTGTHTKRQCGKCYLLSFNIFKGLCLVSYTVGLILIVVYHLYC